MSLWFRVYTDILHSRKVQTLEPELFKLWINLLALAKEGDGLLPSIEDIAYQLRISEADAQRLTEELVKRELLDRTDEGITPHNWDDRQFLSDSDPTAAIRARRYRANKQEVTDESRVTSRTSHGPRAETEPETEYRAETETEAAPVSRAKPRSTRRTVCDEEFFSELQANPAYAMLDVRRIYHKMVAWCQNKGKQPTRGRLINWLSNEDKPLTANGKPPKKPDVGATPPPKELPADDYMADSVEELIAMNDFESIGQMYDAIVERGGAKYEWEIRCVAWYELHKNEPATPEQMAELNASIQALPIMRRDK